MTPPRKSKKSISEQLKNILHSQDGEDHVNVNRAGLTRIGSAAAMDRNSKFFIPCLGDFKSPRGFAWWMVTNEESDRMYPPRGPISELSTVEYHDLLLFAKFFHLASWQKVISQEAALLEKPWTSYYILPGSMIKQYNAWTDYPEIARAMCKYIATADLSVSPCGQFSEGIMDTVNRLLKRKAELLGIEFIPYEQMEAEAKKASKANKPRHRKEGPGATPVASRTFNSEHSHPAPPRQPRPPKQKFNQQQPTSGAPIDYAGLPADNPEDLEAVGQDGFQSSVKTVYQASSPPRVEEPAVVEPVQQVQEEAELPKEQPEDPPVVETSNDNCDSATVTS